MCIVFWTLEHPDYALILATNRDEFLNRPTKDAHFHSFQHEGASDTPGSVLSGRDEQAGGTWFGVNRTGRIALLTNITEPPMLFDSSRGYIVSSFLLSDSSHPLEDEVGKILPQDAKFAGFNLLLLAPAMQFTNSLRFDASLVTNGGAGGIISSRSLSMEERSWGGFSNGVDGKGGAEWPKVQHGLQDFKTVLQNLSPDVEETELTDRLFQMLTWRTPEPITERSQLRNTVHVEPIVVELADSPGARPHVYATRLSTVLLIRKDGGVLFIERDAWKLVDEKVTKAEPPSERTFRFQLATTGLS